MYAEIITIGDELLIGQVINTNQAFIAEKLNSVGIAVTRMTTVGDDEAMILQAFIDAYKSCDVVCVTGGLGPTHDDITKKVICTFFSTDLVMDQEILNTIREILDNRNIRITKASEDQALVPRGCTVLPNSQGSAPGILFERDGKYFIAMPGVPFEMKSIMEKSVIPFFERRSSGRIIRHRTVKTTGIAESILANRLGNVDDFLGGATLAFLPSPYGTRLRITANEPTVDGAEEKIRKIEEYIRAKVEKYIYTVGDEDLEEVVGRLLKERSMTIAVAESCTGGIIAHRLTNVPGSSEYFEYGVITYSNTSKTELLGVPAELIANHGAVSRIVAVAMADGIRKVAGTSIGISTTGIAGPSGGTAEKPVGLVWIGYADIDNSFALQFNFGSDRVRTKERASQAALELVRRKILSIPLEQ
jgi:nicotinamide-nucleotide amidase